MSDRRPAAYPALHWNGAVAGGYFGRALVVDVTDGSADELPPEHVAAPLHRRGRSRHVADAPARAPRRRSARRLRRRWPSCFSPLVGTPLTTSAKFAVVAKSPLTGRLNDALASSHFAIAGKLTGYDAIVVARCARGAVRAARRRRRAPRASAAGDLWGLSAAEAEDRLRERLGPAWRIAAIGPAGRARWCASRPISHDGRHAGRGGLGAVLGRQAHQGGRGACGDEGARRPTRRACSRPPAICASAPSARPPRSTASSARSPTCSRSTRSRTLPTRNFQAATFAGAPQPGRRGAGRGAQRGRENSCASCTIGCEHIYATQGRRRGARRVRERVRARPAVRRRRIADAVLAASARCDALGLDTISAGGTIAWAMECAERGLIDAPWLRFGDGERAAARPGRDRRAAPAWATLLAEGSRRAAAEVGGEAPAFAAARQGAGAARLRAADAAGDGAGHGGQRARGRPQPLRRLRGRPLRRPRPAERRRRRTSPPRSRPRTGRRSWTR